MRHSSYLIQRLQKPLGRPGDNPFSFGGGLRNGGLSDEAMGLLRGIFSFDYMGSAEFEFGAVPGALRDIAEKADDLIGWELVIPLAKVTKGWNDKSLTAPKGDGTVYVLSRSQDRDEIAERIYGLATDRSIRLKESALLDHALRPVDEWDGRTCGWLELDNGFFFFTDREMWEKTAALFDVKVPVAQ